MPVLCCCTSHRLKTKSTSDNAHNVLQPTNPPSIPYAALEPRLAEKQHSPKQDTSLRRPPLATQNAAELDQLIVDDSESEDGRQKGNKRLDGAFGAVRTKLIRRNSQDAGSKRQSHISFGNSQEEIARRAELKRLMHKRIQDELQDELQDEHQNEQKEKKSDDGSSNKSVHSNRYLSSLIELAMPGTGPRDNIEFVVNSNPIPEPQTAMDEYPKPASPDDEEESDPDAETRRCSCPEYALDHDHHRKSVEKIAHGDRSSLPDMDIGSPANKLALTPGNLSLSASQKSFQLSNSATRLDRILGPENGFSSRRGSSSWDGQSALGVWLIAQGLRSRDNSIVPLDDLENDKSTSQNDTCRDRRGIDRVAETPDSSIHSITKMVTGVSPSRRSSIVQLPEEKRDNVLLESQNPRPMAGLPDRDSLGTKERTLSSSGATPRSCSMAVAFNAQHDNSSSKYPSVLPSFQPSPVRSQPNPNSLSIEDLESFQLSPLEWYGSLSLSPNFGNSGEQSSCDTAKYNRQPEPIETFEVQGYQHPTQIAYDAVSMSQSETASFLQREAELRTIEKRFGQVLSRKKPSSPVISRFREEFEDPSLGRTRRASFMSMIHLTMPRRFKSGTKSQDEFEVISSSSHTANTVLRFEKAHKREKSSASKRRSNMSIRSHVRPLSAEVYRKPDREESATDLWQRAIRSEAQERRGSSNRLSTPKPEHRKTPSSSRSLNLALGSWKGAGPRNNSSSTDANHHEPSQLTPKTDELSHCDQDSRSKWLIQHWVSQMLPEATANPPSEIESNGSFPYTNKLVKPPRSWARYPSHTRDERTASATIKDNVNPKDFAIKEISPYGQVFWATDREPASQRSRLSGLTTRSLSFKLGKAVKSKVSKFMLNKNKLGDEGNNPLNGRRGSAQAGGYLDYPELEILPTESGYQELKALEKQIENMKGGTRQMDTGELLARRRSVKSLGSRISALMHEAAEHAHDHDDASGLPGSQSVPVTPTGRPHSCHPKSSTLTEVFVTPQSRFSIGDAPPQEKSVSDRGSTKSAELAIVRGSKSEMNIVNGRPRSTTWSGISLGQVPNLNRLDDLRRELESIIQSKGNNSRESLSHAKTETKDDNADPETC